MFYFHFYPQNPGSPLYYYWVINRLSLLGDKRVAIIGGQTGCPYWGTNGFPYWWTNSLPLLGDKLVALIGGQTDCHYWGINRLPLLGDKQVALIEGQTSSPLKDKQVLHLCFHIFYTEKVDLCMFNMSDQLSLTPFTVIGL